jgi:shikimate dehydrogenase
MTEPPSIRQITSRLKVTLVMGDPIEHSLSPLIHNAGYQASGLPFVMVAARVSVESLPLAMKGATALGFAGCAVTMPLKQHALLLADDVDPVARLINAANTLVLNGGRCTAYNTDWLGITEPLERTIPVKGARVLVIGAGGAAQAALYALSIKGARVRIFNRNIESAQEIASKFGVAAHSLESLKTARDFDALINTTPLGMTGVTPHDLAEYLPTLTPDHLVFETIYAPLETPLIKAARAAGARMIFGSEMFLEQAVAQFALITGHQAPRDSMEHALRHALSKEALP